MALDKNTAKQAADKWATGGGKFKEQMEAITTKNGGAKELESVISKEKPVTEVVEIPTEVEVEKAKEKAPELGGYIEKVEKEAELQKPVTDDYTQQVLIGSANPQKPTVTLPLTEGETQLALHRQVWESVRWLAEWCVRQVKILKDRAKYKST